MVCARVGGDDCAFLGIYVLRISTEAKSLAKVERVSNPITGSATPMYL